MLAVLRCVTSFLHSCGQHLCPPDLRLYTVHSMHHSERVLDSPLVVCVVSFSPLCGASECSDSIAFFFFLSFGASLFGFTFIHSGTAFVQASITSVYVSRSFCVVLLIKHDVTIVIFT